MKTIGRLRPWLLVCGILMLHAAAPRAGMDEPSLPPSLLPSLLPQIPVSPALLAVSDLAAESRVPPPLPVLYILPLGGGLDGREVEFVRRSLTAFYNMDVRVLDPAPIPAESWYPPRKRYRAEKILDHLSARIPEDGHRIIGLTAEDISTTSQDRLDWGMVGLADYDRPVCVVSTHRCTGPGVTAALAMIRAGKVAVHEIGHTLGLPHCPTAGCLMTDAGGRIATCDEEDGLCVGCKEILMRSGGHLGGDNGFTWTGAAMDLR